MLRVLQMRREDRASALEQALQLSVLRIRDQRLCDYADDCLVVVDFIIDIHLVELRAAHLLQQSQSLDQDQDQEQEAPYIESV
jgi:hypothetical protein